LCLCERTAEAEKERREHAEWLARRVVLFRLDCRLTGKLRRMSLESFGPSSATRKAHAAARELVDAWPGERRGLVLSGQCGCGKTHLAAGIGNALVEKGISVEFWPVFDLLQAIRDSFDGREDVAARVSKLGLLILDDLGNERIGRDEKGDWAREQLFRIIYWRELNELPVVVTTNHSVDVLESKLGGPTVSRLLGMCAWFQIEAGDYRVRI
jgi:DNA replication protein DnaC